MFTKPLTRLRTISLLLLASSVLLLSGDLRFVYAQEATPGPGDLLPQVGYALDHDLSPAFSTLQASPSMADPGVGAAIHNPLPKSLNLSLATLTDSALQTSPASGVMPATSFNFEGIHNINKVLPPDANGDVGPNHYIQWVNLSLQIWQLDRGTGTATPVYSEPIPGNKIWEGFSGPCQSSNDGDPIVLYDHLADRWLLSQFALPYYPAGPFYQCVAISQTSNPAGAWYRYAFQVSETKMNDYPHFGVWPDGYYLSINQFTNGAWAGAGVLVFERERMLLGLPARTVYFDLQPVHEGFGGMLPADLDGAPPAPGTPGIFAEVDDASWIGPADAIRLWEFHVDWTQPQNSTFGLSGQPNFVLPVDSFTPLCSGVSNCIPQPETNQQLDALADRLMHRVQYRNFGSYATLVANHTVNTGGGRAGVRWYELRQTGGEWSIHQQGTYAGDGPNTEHRWMASAAIDGAGNLALGYSVSSDTVYPSIRYAGRLAGDPPGILAQGEATLVEGGGIQLISNRWGDYSMLAVDPLDDCTFWFTSEYYATTSNSGWTTRVGSFAFPTCLSHGRGYLQGYVTDRSTGQPLAGVQVQVGGFTTQTGEDGFYQVYGLPPGSYSVTATIYGFEESRVDGVAVSGAPGGWQDFALTPVPFVQVSGYIRDGSGQGWPLYARLEVAAPGYSSLKFTDPASGFFSLRLAQGVEHTLTISGILQGYNDLTEVITPPSGGLDKNIHLVVNGTQCTAPGYLSSSGCIPQQGALMTGQVYDANTGQGVVGAEIAVEGSPAYKAVSLATPDDPDVADGYYALFNGIQGEVATQTRTIEVSSRLYGRTEEQVLLSRGQVIIHDFLLPAGLLVMEPLSLTQTINPTEIITQVVSIRNTGGLEASFRLSEVNAPLGVPHPTGPFAVPTRHVSPKRLSDLTAASVYDYHPPATNSIPGGNVFRRWTTGLPSTWGLGVSPHSEDVWVGDAQGEAGQLYRYHLDGAGGEERLANGVPGLVFSADMAFDPYAGTFWQVRVGGDNCLSEVNPAQGTLTGARLCPAFNNPQRGLAFDPLTQTFYSGSWVDGVLYHFDRSGRILDSRNLDLNFSGLAYNPASGHLFALVNADQGFDIYVLDPADEYRILGGFEIDGLDTFSQGGLDMDCNGHLWLVNQSTREVFEVDSGEDSACTWEDIPWLEASPSSGVIAPDATAEVILTFHGDSASQPSNRAHLVVTSDTPYPALQLPLELKLSGYGIAATPGEVHQFADPGSWASTSLLITNRGLYSDSYQISISGSVWDTVIRPGFNRPSIAEAIPAETELTVGPILPGDSTEVRVRVFIPESAAPGEADQATLRITSNGDPQVSYKIGITSGAYWKRLFPVINR